MMAGIGKVLYRRDDTGGGACELFWVESLEILDSQSLNGELQ